MEIGNFMVGITQDLVTRALDAAALRHNVLASNIANASNPEYAPMRVNFEEQLQLLRADLLRRTDAAEVRPALAGVEPRIEADPAYAGSSDQIRLDAEISKMMQNAVYYQSLLTAMSKGGSIMRLAVREGRN
jgi:flagellar basal-body rod protein FlgB